MIGLTVTIVLVYPGSLLVHHLSLNLSFLPNIIKLFSLLICRFTMVFLLEVFELKANNLTIFLGVSRYIYI